MDQQRGPDEEPAQPHIAVAAKEEAELEEARLWERVLGHSAGPLDEVAGGKQLGAARQRLRRLGVGAAALGRRLSALLPAGLGGRLAIGWPIAMAVVLLTVALLCGPLAAWQARASSSELAALRQQVESKLDTAAAARAKLSRQLADAQGLLEAVDDRQAALADSLQTLQASYTARAGSTDELHAEVAAAKAELADLQVATAAAAAQAAAVAEAAAAGATRPDDGAASTVPGVTHDEERLRQLAREEAAAELDLYAADRTGQPDYALAAAGAAVLAHSPAHAPPQLGGAGLGAIRDKLGNVAGTGRVHPQANKASLGAAAGCFWACSCWQQRLKGVTCQFPLQQPCLLSAWAPKQQPLSPFPSRCAGAVEPGVAARRLPAPCRLRRLGGRAAGQAHPPVCLHL